MSALLLEVRLNFEMGRFRGVFYGGLELLELVFWKRKIFGSCHKVQLGCCGKRLQPCKTVACKWPGKEP